MARSRVPLNRTNSSDMPLEKEQRNITKLRLSRQSKSIESCITAEYQYNSQISCWNGSPLYDEEIFKWHMIPNQFATEFVSLCLS